MKTVKTLLAALITSAVLVAPVGAQNNDVSEASVIRLLQLTGGANMAEQMFTQIIQALQQQGVVDAKFIEELRDDTDFDELIRRTIPVYQRHLTQDQVDAAVRFWSSEEGQGLVRAMPEISTDTYRVGQRWGAAIAERYKEKIEMQRTSDQ